MPRRRDGIFDVVGVPTDISIGGLARPPVVGAHTGVDPSPELMEAIAGGLGRIDIIRPDVIAENLSAGAIADKITVQPQGLDELIRAAMGAAAQQRVIWRDGDSEVLVHLDQTRTKTLDGLVLVGVTLECDETGVQEITVPFAVGSESMTAGMLGITEAEPRGHPLLVQRWGEAIVATAWKALLDVGQTLAAEAGTDEDGAALVAGALVAKPDGLQVIPQARHIFEKIVIT